MLDTVEVATPHEESFGAPLVKGRRQTHTSTLLPSASYPYSGPSGEKR